MSTGKICNCAVVLSLVLVAGGVSACTPTSTYRPGPPDGWVAEGTRWWKPGVDTSKAFRNLESLSTMRVKNAEIVYSTSMSLARQKDLALRQLSRAVKVSLMPVFRNHPEVVDSLFERHAVPRLMEANLSTAPDRLVDKYKKETYRILARHFREPRAVVKLGEDVPIAYPDSLREAGVGGRVPLQIYVDKEGLPVAIALLESAHHVLDDIAMKAATQARWQPAYLLVVGKSEPIESWVRLTIPF